jgi:Flp pilus assembly protein TadD
MKRKTFLLLSAFISLVACPPASPAVPPFKQPARPAVSRRQSDAAFARREDAYRANNLGVALLEQYKYREGAESFRRALALSPRLALAQINLGIALYNVPDAVGAEEQLTRARTLAPDAPQPSYVLGLIARARGQADEAVADFERVLALDPQDVGANVQLGQLYAQQRKYAEAARHFRAALDAEPYNVTALYNLATALLRGGERDEGQKLLARFQELRQSGAGTTVGQNYLEQGRYAEAVASTGAEPDLVERATPAVAFNDATTLMLPYTSITRGASPPRQLTRSFDAGALLADQFAGGATLFDYDGDGALDLLDLTPSGARLLHNVGGRYVDVTARSGDLRAESGASSLGAVAGDYDNDGRADLFVLRVGALKLYHNDGAGRFSDRTAASAFPAYPYLSVSAAFADVDHDGDLDIFVAGLADATEARVKPLLGKEGPFGEGGPSSVENGARGQFDRIASLPPAPNLLLRNNGNGTFTDITAAAKVAGGRAHAVAVVPTDYDNRRDVDLLVVNYDAAPSLYRNLRDGSFGDVATEAGLARAGAFTGVAAGDLNKDGYTDFFFDSAGGDGLFAMSDGRAHFKLSPAPSNARGARAAQFIDYDNDGLLDLVAPTQSGARVWRNVGDGFEDVTARAVASSLSPRPVAAGARAARSAGALIGTTGRMLASGDVDGDGDIDLFFRSASGRLVVARNDGGNRNRSVRVRLAGRVSNRTGVEAKVVVRAGSLSQRSEIYAATPAPAPADLLFGIGSRTSADAVRVIWPSGTVQAETDFARATARGGRSGANGTSPLSVVVTELDRKPSSCPYLYAWNGRGFEFITDFMGGGEMGYLEEPGRYNVPDPDEYVRVRGDQLKERDGRYELRVTDELEEALFADRFQLIAVAHPIGTEVYPNEGMTDPPRPFVLYKTRGAHPPLSAVDDHGRDVLARVARIDRQYPDDFRRDAIRGYAEEHTLTMKLDGGATEGARAVLLLTGWTDYAWSSDNVAATQAGKSSMLPALQVKDARGRWKTVIEDIGIPVGRPQTVTVDLTGKFLSASREVRLVTNMRILWDQILVDTSTGDSPAQLTRLDPVSATLRRRGFSRETTPDGGEPYGYDYSQVSYASPWKAMPGRYTREGDVRELLSASDDMFVVSRPGDEISLSFDATKLPPLPAGWTRTFLLYADGFSKEMDINSASPDQVSPLPFHGMSKYPYSAPEAYPLTDARRDYLERYNTRLVASEVPSIDSLFLRPGSFNAATSAGSVPVVEGRR